MNRVALLVVGVFGLNLFGKLLGFLRIQQIGAQIGLSEVADSLFLALIVTAFWEAFVLSGAVIPTLTSEYPKRVNEFGQSSAMEESVNLLFVFAIVALFMSIFLFFLGETIASVIAPGMSNGAKTMFSAITKALSPMPVFATATLFLAGINRLHDGEIHYAISAILINALSLPVLVWGESFSPDHESMAVYYGLAISGATLVASIYQFGVMRPTLRRSIAQTILNRLMLGSRLFTALRPTIAHYLPLIVPLSVAVGAREINAIVDAGFASTVSAGGIATLGLADRLTRIVIAVLGGAIFVVCEPRWSRFLANVGSSKPVEQISKDSAAIVTVVLPVYLSIGFLAPEVAGLAFGYGQMSGESTSNVASLVPWLAGAGFFAFMNVTLSRAMVFDRKPGEVLKVNLAAVVVNFLLNSILVGRYGLSGIVIATFLVTVVQQLSLLFLGRKMRAVRSVARGAWGLTTLLVVSIGVAALLLSRQVLVDSPPHHRLLAASFCAALGALVGFLIGNAGRRMFQVSRDGVQD